MSFFTLIFWSYSNFYGHVCNFIWKTYYTTLQLCNKIPYASSRNVYARSTLLGNPIFLWFFREDPDPLPPSGSAHDFFSAVGLQFSERWSYLACWQHEIGFTFQQIWMGLCILVPTWLKYCWLTENLTHNSINRSYPKCTTASFKRGVSNMARGQAGPELKKNFFHAQLNWAWHFNPS